MLKSAEHVDAKTNTQHQGCNQNSISTSNHCVMDGFVVREAIDKAFSIARHHVNCIVHCNSQGDSKYQG